MSAFAEFLDALQKGQVNLAGPGASGAQQMQASNPATVQDLGQAVFGSAAETTAPVLQRNVLSAAPTNVPVRHQGPVLLKITISSDSPQIVVGKEVQFSAQGDFSNQTHRVLTSTEVTWSSSNPKVANIDAKTGHALITGSGNATIKAEDATGNTPPAPPATFDVKTEGTHSKQTPFGKLEWYADQEETVLPLVNKALQTYATFDALDTKMNKDMVELAGITKRLKSEKEIIKEIREKAPPAVRDEAHIAKNAENLLKVVKSNFQDFKDRVKHARVDLTLAIHAMDVKNKQKEVRELQERAEQVGKILDTAFVVVGKVTEIATAPELFVVHNLGPAIEAVGKLGTLFVENHLLEDAKKLQDEIDKTEIADAATKYAEATEKLGEAQKLQEDARNNLTEFNDTYVEYQKQAEKGFDETPRTEFKFADLRRALELAEADYKLSAEDEQAATAALSAVYVLYKTKWLPPHHQEAEVTLRSWLNDIDRKRGIAKGYHKDSEAITKTLQHAYLEAQKALAHAPGTGAPGAKK